MHIILQMMTMKIQMKILSIFDPNILEFDTEANENTSIGAATSSSTARGLVNAKQLILCYV